MTCFFSLPILKFNKQIVKRYYVLEVAFNFMQGACPISDPNFLPLNSTKCVRKKNNIVMT